MKRALHGSCIAAVVMAMGTSTMAQDAATGPQAQPIPARDVRLMPGQVEKSPAAQLGGTPAGAAPAGTSGMTGGDGAFAGYIPSASAGMVVGGSSASPATPVLPGSATGGETLPELSDGLVMNQDKVDGFNAAIEQNFPMTPEMIRRYRDIYEATDRAMKNRVEPEAHVDSSFISLEPGEKPAQLTLAPGIASAVGFYDVTGQPWPVEQYVMGNGADFQIVQLGEGANTLVITPLQRFGWSNIIVRLKGQSKPAVIRVGVSEVVAQDRHDIQIMTMGPNAVQNTAAQSDVTEAGSGLLLSALSGVDLPANAVTVPVQGVNARAWKIGDSIVIRSKHALLSPTWSSSMSGPDGVRVYEIKSGPVALFSVDGVIVRADLVLP